MEARRAYPASGNSTTTTRYIPSKVSLSTKEQSNRNKEVYSQWNSTASSRTPAVASQVTIRAKCRSVIVPSSLRTIYLLIICTVHSDAGRRSKTANIASCHAKHSYASAHAPIETGNSSQYLSAAHLPHSKVC